ncbi:uracil-DNA glycosylase, partial [Candidatus Saccharibacteria bacterium]|nr:uracil-DNA glycosylase [Candidatus Saccharibacteria bacterium]
MHESWKPILQSEFNQPYFKDLSQFLTQAYETKTIYPPKQQVFSAFTTDLNNIKVVIIGQDPYHGPRQANGLAFSVHNGIQFPPSLRNIFKEVHDDV